MIDHKFDLHVDIVTGAWLGQKNVFQKQRNVHTDVSIEGYKVVNQFDIPSALSAGVTNVVSALFPAYTGKNIEMRDQRLQIDSYTRQLAFYRDFQQKIDSSAINFHPYFHIEGIYFLDTKNIDTMSDQFIVDGIQSIGIMWNDDNTLGCGNHTKNDTGLTPLGKRFIKKCIKNHIVIDLAHTSYKTFFDIVELLPDQYPAMFSHGNVYDIHPHNRNLKNDQIKTLIERRYPLGLSFVGEFVGSDHFEDWMNHLESVVQMESGQDIVSIGSDFDGMFEEDLINQIDTIQCIPFVEKEIGKRYGADLSKKIFFENPSRLFKKTIK